MRRMGVLLILGLLHAHLLWYGDMLVPLALSGAVVFFAAGSRPGRCWSSVAWPSLSPRYCRSR